MSQHGQLGAIPPPPVLSVFPPLRAFAKWRCDTPPPPQKGYLSDTCTIPYENKANGCDTPLCDTISKGYCAIWVSRTGPLSVCVCTCARACVHACMHTCVHVCICACVRSCHCVCVCARARVCVCRSAWLRPRPSKNKRPLKSKTKSDKNPQNLYFRGGGERGDPSPIS